MSNDNDKFLTIRLLETPAGQEVIQVFIASLFSTRDIVRSFDTAKEVAENKGIWVPLEITLILDSLRVIGPSILQQLQKKK
jgi:hypothetical protein